LDDKLTEMAAIVERKPDPTPPSNLLLAWW
jgi:hypothetical protein